MITNIPTYQSPIEQSLRCICGLRYLVLLSDGIGEQEARSRERAEMIKARFIDARLIYFIECECGELLTFVDEASDMVM